MVVIERCARLEGVDPLDLDPLYDTIDPDVLDSACAAPGFTSLEFTYCGRVVTLRSVGDELAVTIDDAATPATGPNTTTGGEPSL
ncbi:hypothetical protein B1756_16810 [Natrarchaeobaculum aegyptiacum]|uniref:Halobacterial output domain-containing protein n=2 Tax=Natrarchaeobaculum aegyptiacum TaxID=745377 RepID=A0A2Z2HY85_9EURY|nr:hypothetical protein B1756_16810 [Natrarchaeobaculum aegyptiacum]